MNDCYLQALSQAPCAHRQVYVSVLQRIHISLLTRRLLELSCSTPTPGAVACFSDPGIILEQPRRRIFVSWICSGSLVETRPPVSIVTVPRLPICADSFRLSDGSRRIVGPNVVCISLSLEYSVTAHDRAFRSRYR
jgi:hypothetical protein